MNLAPGGQSTLRVGKLTVYGTLDVNDNRLIVQATDATCQVVLQQTTEWIRSAYGGGAWTGKGITSAVAQANRNIGVAIALNDNGSGGKLHEGEDLNAILVQATYYGDVNLDGVVNLADYFAIDSGYLNKLSGFVNGDMNFDGEINLNDYFLIDSAYLNQGTRPSTNPASAAANAKLAKKASTQVFSKSRIIRSVARRPGRRTRAKR